MDIVLSSLALVCATLIICSAVLCYNSRSGWYWFLITGTMFFCCIVSFYMSLQMIKALNIDMSKLIPSQVNIKAEDNNE